MHDLTRVRRSRAKGAELPPDTLCVGRPGRWGNPWTVQPILSPGGYRAWWVITDHECEWPYYEVDRTAASFSPMTFRVPFPYEEGARSYAVSQFRKWLWQPERAQLRDEFCAVAFLIRLARRFHDDRDFVDR